MTIAKTFEQINTLEDFQRVVRYGCNVPSNPRTHARDFELLKARQANRDALSSKTSHPLVGDIVTIKKTGKRYVVSHCWDRGCQLSDCGSLSWHDSGTMSFSGGLDPQLPYNSMKRSDKKIERYQPKVQAWFFSQNEMGAHRGCYVLAKVNHWECDLETLPTDYA